MTTRKLSLSIIILIVAAATMVSGTYAWFLVGGFAELFDIGFNVMDVSEGGIELSGSASGTFKTSLEQTDFPAGSFIAEGGSYRLVSSADGLAFKAVELTKDATVTSAEGTSLSNYFTSKDPADINAGGASIDYNDFTIYARSTDENNIDAGMKIAITGEAAVAGRVSVTYGDTTTVYALDGETATSAVTSEFTGTVVDVNSNSIIDSGDTNSSEAGLAAQNFVELAADGSIKEDGQPIILSNISGNTGSSPIRIRVWIEGNDTEAVHLDDENTISGKDLSVKITFTSSAA